MKEDLLSSLILNGGRNPERVCVHMADENQTSEVQIILITARRAYKVQVSDREFPFRALIL